jgi:hypothetical protein
MYEKKKKRLWRVSFLHDVLYLLDQQSLPWLLAIVSKYGDPVADEVRDLTLAASREIGSGKPEREVFRRLAEATRKLMEKLGPGVIEVGALADAVAKITDMIRHW